MDGNQVRRNESCDSPKHWALPGCAARSAIDQYVLNCLGLSSPRVTVLTKVIEQFAQKGANFRVTLILASNISRERRSCEPASFMS